MRSSFGHNGDMFEGIKEIYDSLPENAQQRGMLIELAIKTARLDGDEANLEFCFPEAYERTTHGGSVL